MKLKDYYLIMQMKLVKGDKIISIPFLIGIFNIIMGILMLANYFVGYSPMYTIPIFVIILGVILLVYSILIQTLIEKGKIILE